MKRRSLAVCFVVSSIVFSPILIWGQIRSGTITGVVTDASRGTVPAADVTVINLDTNVTQTTQTNAVGEFTVPYLAAGRYKVMVKKEGFRAYEQTDINVPTGQSVRVDVSLAVGALEASVEVIATAQQLQSETSNVQGSVDARVIESIPNITQNPLQYVLLQPGITSKSQMLDSASPDSVGVGYNSRRYFSAFSVNGGQAFTNDIQMDGLTIQGSAWNEVTVLPNTDGIQEVRVVSNNFTAEYGRGQGVISVASKSGTNQFHGSASFRMRNEGLNANTFANNQRSIARTKFRLNEYAGTIGGPIVIPKIVNGRDRLFFFTSLQKMTHDDTAAWMGRVPTDLERQGNFSQTQRADLTGKPAPVLLFDPFSATLVETDLYRRQPIPGNIYSNPNKYALKIMNAFPKPNRTPDDANYNTNNFYLAKTRDYGRYNINNRVDYRVGKHFFYGNFGSAWGSIITPRPWDTPDGKLFYVSPNASGGGPERNADRNPYAQAGDTIVLSPSMVLDVRYGITRIKMDNESGKNDSFPYDDYGIPKIVQNNMAIGRGFLPEIPLTEFMALGSTGWQHKNEKQTNHQLAFSLTKTVSRWTLKWGGEYRNYLSNYSDFLSGGATFNTDSPVTTTSYTAEYINASGAVRTDYAKNNNQRGFAGAVYFSGGGSWGVGPAGNMIQPAMSQKYFALYTQNDWRATQKLTINLGLRWDLQPGPTERWNRFSSWDFDKPNSFGSQGRVVFPGVDGYGRNLWALHYKDFGPRVGMAYRMTDDTVIRGGYGLTYLPTNTGYYDGSYNYGMWPFGQTIDQRPFGYDPKGVPIARFWEEAPHIFTPAVGGVESNPIVYGISSPKFNYRNYQDGRAQQWNLFIEKTYKRDWILSIGYSGMKGDHLENQNWYNPGNIETWAAEASPSLLQQWRSQWLANGGVTNPSTVLVQNPLQPAAGTLLKFQGTQGGRTVPQWFTTSKYPMLVGATVKFTNGYSDYHSMILQVKRSVGKGLLLSGHYTWSKSLGYTDTSLQDGQGFNNATTSGGKDFNNIRNNRAYSNQDTPHRLVIVASYTLPFGKGRALEIANRTGRALLGGWQFSGVYTANSGLPMGASGLTDGAINGRAWRDPSVPIEVPKELQRWYDGKTTVTLPSGHQITPCAYCFLKFNSDAFRGQVVKFSETNYKADILYWGTAPRNYGDFRGHGRNNLDFTLTREFGIKERARLELVAYFTNFLNHTQFSSYTMSLGSTNTVYNPAIGLLPGMSSSANFGTRSNSTYQPRQGILSLRLRF